MLSVLKNMLYLLFDSDKLVTTLEDKYKNKIGLRHFGISTQIYNAFSDKYYSDHIVFYANDNTFKAIVDCEFICFDLLSNSFKKKTLDNYNSIDLIENTDASLYEISMKYDKPSLIIIDDSYINYKFNRLKENSIRINIFDNQLFKLYQNYKNSILHKLRKNDIILNLCKEANEISYTELKEYYMLLLDLKIKYRIYLNKLNNDKQKVFDDLKNLKANLNSLLRKYILQNLKSYQAVISYKYKIDDYMDGFIIHCKFSYVNILDLILYSDFVETFLKS